MRTRRAPYDYARRYPIIPQLVNACMNCGGQMANLPEGYVCIKCRRAEFAKVWEFHLDTFRRGLAELKEIQKG